MINNSFFQKQKYLYLVFFIFFAQFIILDIYYFDDLFRIEDGAFGWRSDGRALGGLFYKVLIQFRSPLPDIYPLPLIIAGLLFCYMCSLSFVGFGITDQKQQALLLLVIISSPLALANWLFRYDSAFMLLSVGFALLPFYCAQQSHKKFFIVSVLSLLGALTTYQISINIYIGFAAIYAFKLTLENHSIKKLFSFIIIAGVAFITAYLIYSQIILKIMPTHWLGDKYREIPNLNNINVIIIQNISSTISMFKNFLQSGLIAPLVFSVLCNFYAIDKTKKDKKILILSSYCIALITSLFAISGIMLISPTAPFIARTYLGVITLLIFPSIVLLLLKYQKLFYISIVFMSITTLMIDRAALNAVSAEFRLQNSISEQIRTELSLNHIKNIDEIIIIGNPQLSNAAIINSKAFPIIKHILPRPFNNSYDGGRYVLMFNGFNKITYPETEKQLGIKKQLSSAQPIASNHIYTLYYIDKIPVIRFN